LPTTGVGMIVVDHSPPAWFATPDAAPNNPNDKARTRKLPNGQ